MHPEPYFPQILFAHAFCELQHLVEVGNINVCNSVLAPHTHTHNSFPWKLVLNANLSLGFLALVIISVFSYMCYFNNSSSVEQSFLTHWQSLIYLRNFLTSKEYRNSVYFYKIHQETTH